MNIFIGLCGHGNRFTQGGFDRPKYLIVYHGAPMIYHSVETIGVEGKIHFIARKDHLHKYKFLEKMLLELGDEIIVCDKDTGGAAESLLLAKPYVKDLNAPMLSVNCDQHMNWKSFIFKDEIARNTDTSYIVTYKENSTKCSYVREENGLVVEVREKKVISNDATTGYYHWARTGDFFQDAEQMMAEGHKENGEYYVAPVYNYSIARGLKVKKFPLNAGEFAPVGTPDDLQKYYENYNSRFD